MNRLIDILTLVIGLVAFAVAAWQLVVFVTFKDARGLPDMTGGINHLWFAIVAAVIAVGSVVILYVRHPRQEEEIHITK